VLWAAIIPGIFLLGCVRQESAKIAVPDATQILKSETRFTKQYVLAPADQIEIVVRGVPEVSRTVVIRPDGHISLPLLDDVMAAGMTTGELDAKLTELFSARLVNPEVTIIGAQLRQPMIYVIGDANNTAAIPWRNAPTAVQALAAAGGLRRSAAARQVALLRLSEDGYLQVMPISGDGDAKGQATPYLSMRTTLLQPDDILFIPESGRSQFARFVQDFVAQPLLGINSVVGTYLNFKFVEAVTR
jgi:polysaccharide export outer membrane protein